MDELWKQAVKDITDGAYSRIEKLLAKATRLTIKLSTGLTEVILTTSPKLSRRRLHVLPFWVEPGLSRIYWKMIERNPDEVAMDRSRFAALPPHIAERLCLSGEDSLIIFEATP